jgi:hypothetical protein
MKIRLNCWSNERHLSQIYTGLTMLHRLGQIELEQRIFPRPPPATDPKCPPHLVHAKGWHCSLDSNGLRYYFDVHDSHEIDADALDSCDVYLKRGYVHTARNAKVRALGLNYQVCADGFDLFELERRFRLEGWRPAARYFAHRQLTVSDFEAEPTTGEPRVLFLCRTWQPEPGRGRERNAERVVINDGRAACIVALRKAFGERCIAGFAPSAYAQLRYPQAVVSDPSITERRRYVRLMRTTPICVATVGLHRSNGWKLGEYIASSRAIVSEELQHDVPGLVRGRNYLAFKTTSECVDRVGELMESQAKRSAIAEANRDYYLTRLRPDRFIANAISSPQDARVDPLIRSA